MLDNFELKTKSTFRTHISVMYESTNISLSISEDLLSFNYVDNINDEADSLTILLKDNKGKWCNTWTPERNAKIQATLKAHGNTLKTGLTLVDTLRANGSSSGRTFEFQSVSIPLDNTIRRTIKTRNFEDFSLQQIASQIASEANVTLMFDSSENPTYDRIDQRQESDLSFLKRLCDEAGLTVKVAFNKLVLFDQKSYESKPPIATYILNIDPILSWSFQAQQSERYRACTVKWRDIKHKTVEKSGAGGGDGGSQKSLMRTNSEPPLTYKPQNESGYILDKDSGYDIDLDPQSKVKKPKEPKGPKKTKAEILEYTYEDPTVGEGGQTYVLKRRCNSLAEAQRIAKAKLRQLNLRQTTGSLSIVGNPNLSAGSVIMLKKFGSFDGKFIIERATHNYSTSGYITTLELRRVNEKY